MTDRATTADDSRTGSVPTAPAHGDGITPANNVVIWLLLISTFVVFLNETIMSVALTDIGEAFEVEPAVSQWVSTAFMLTMAVVIPTTGFLIRRIPLRTLFFTAMGLFTAGTLIAAVAPFFGALIAGRVVQAAGTGIMMPLLMTTILALVPSNHRGQLMGRVSIVISVAPALGPTVGGLILQYFDWRFMFWLVLPIAVAALALGAARLRNVTETGAAQLDLLSVPLSALGFAGTIFGLSSIAESVQEPAVIPPWIPLTIGLVSLALFVWRQLSLQRRDAAFLDLRVFQSRTFTLTIVMFVVAMMAMFGTIILLPIFAQQVMLLDTAITGLLVLPGGVLQAALGPIVGRLYDRWGPRPLAVPGAVLVSLALWSFLLLTPTTPVWQVMAQYAVLAIGLALLFTPLFTTALGSIEPKLYSHGSATLSTIQQVAGALGTAIFITLFTIGTQAQASAGAEQIEALNSGAHLAFLAGGAISIVTILLAFFLKKPADAPAGAPAMH